MSNITQTATPNPSWLKGYYAVRALFSAAWVALAFTVGRSRPELTVALVVAYPAWDGIANYYDARRSGGLRENPTQLTNLLVSAVVTVAVAIAVTRDFHAVLGIIGVWAILSGVLQLSTGVRRWGNVGAQWPMIVSGAQSVLAGGFFVKQATDVSVVPDVSSVAPYAAFGAAYFAISAAVLTLSRRK